MANIRVDFGFFNGMKPEYIREGKITSGFRYVGTHMIFDIKMDGKFTRKYRLVTGGHKTAPTLYITYSSVVTREIIILEFLIAGLNNLYFASKLAVHFYIKNQLSLSRKTVDQSRIRIRE